MEIRFPPKIPDPFWLGPAVVVVRQSELPADCMRATAQLGWKSEIGLLPPLAI